MRLKADMLDAVKIAEKVYKAAANAKDSYKEGYYYGVICALSWATDGKDAAGDIFLDTQDKI